MTHGRAIGNRAKIRLVAKVPGFEQSRVGPRGVRDLGRREGVREVALGEDGPGIPFVERIGMGILCARGSEDSAQSADSTYFGASWGDDKVRDGNYRANCYGCISFWGGERTAPVGFVSGETDSGCMTCAATSGSGWRIAGTRAMRARLLNGSARMSGDCSHRVVRGGSWFDGPEFLRVANRETGIRPETGTTSSGFAWARTLSAVSP